MKTRKKVLSLILTLCTLISMFAMPAMAADTEEFPVKVHVMTRAETAARFAVSTHSLSGNGTAFLPKNNSTGTMVTLALLLLLIPQMSHSLSQMLLVQLLTMFSYMLVLPEVVIA